LTTPNSHHLLSKPKHPPFSPTAIAIPESKELILVRNEEKEKMIESPCFFDKAEYGTEDDTSNVNNE
jgi:hypothetical protein